MALLLSRAEIFVQLGNGHYKEQFCEIAMNSDQYFSRRCNLKIFLSIACSGGPFVRLSETICEIVVKGIMRNNSVKYFEFGPLL